VIRRALVAALAALAVAAPAASADQDIVAGPGTVYLTQSVTMAQGERLTFRNLDTTGHDVVSRKRSADGKRLFQTPVIGTGSSALVVGSQYLTTGDYDFYCSVHPYMEGTVHVTSAGKPASRPGGDSRAPGVAVQIDSSKLGKVAKSGKLQVSFHTDEAATVNLSGSVRAGGATYKLAKATRTVPRNRPVRVSLGMGSKAQQALKRASKATFKVFAKTRDKAGNRGGGSAHRTLRR
jgi:plastocyanin